MDNIEKVLTLSSIEQQTTKTWTLTNYRSKPFAPDTSYIGQLFSLSNNIQTITVKKANNCHHCMYVN